MELGTDITLNVLWAALLGYLMGSIPFGLILTRLAGKGDVRTIGSGNIGATNVLRTGSKGLAAATLLLDLLKGFLPVYLAKSFMWDDMGWAALFTVIGHCFPVWLGFKGGKGVATTAGVAFGMTWHLGVTYAVVWLGILAIFRISSVAGMAAVLATTLAAFVMGSMTYFKVMLLIALLVLVLHRANIRRLIRGEEPKVGAHR